MTAPNQRWAMGFMPDVLATGAKVRVFTLIDVWRWDCVAFRVTSRFTGSDVMAPAQICPLHRGA